MVHKDENNDNLGERKSGQNIKLPITKKVSRNRTGSEKEKKKLEIGSQKVFKNKES